LASICLALLWTSLRLILPACSTASAAMSNTIVSALRRSKQGVQYYPPLRALSPLLHFLNTELTAAEQRSGAACSSTDYNESHSWAFCSVRALCFLVVWLCAKSYTLLHIKTLGVSLIAPCILQWIVSCRYYTLCIKRQCTADLRAIASKQIVLYKVLSTSTWSLLFSRNLCCTSSGPNNPNAINFPAIAACS